MKTKKFRNTYWIWYKTDNGILHGFDNSDDEYIGYWYQHKRKGFWLRKYKI